MDNKLNELEELIKLVICKQPLNDKGTAMTEDDISQMIGRSKGYISQARSRAKSGRDDVSDKLLDLIRYRFDIPTMQTELEKKEVEQPKKERPENLEKLIDANRDACAGNRVLAESHWKLVNMLEKKLSTAGVALGNPQERQRTFLELFGLLLRAGVEEGRWLSEAEGQAKLGNLLRENPAKKKE